MAPLIWSGRLKLVKMNYILENSCNVAIKTSQIPVENKFKPKDRGPDFLFVEGNLGSNHQFTLRKWIYIDNKHVQDSLQLSVKTV